ncbi:MAG: hypothetical protein M3450_16660 [Actinomycetota bacterium]|nr:hypothetical protein [Actinomycetota bacterium]
MTGSSFAVGRGDAPTLPVQLRWNGVDGMVLAEATPDRAGNISATFTVPDGMPGYYVLVATQKDAGASTPTAPRLGPRTRSSVPAVSPW